MNKLALAACLAVLAPQLQAEELTPAQKLEVKIDRKEEVSKSNKTDEEHWEELVESKGKLGLVWHEPKKQQGAYGGPIPGHWRPQNGLTPAQKFAIEKDRGEFLHPLQKRLAELSEERETADEARKREIDRSIYSISTRINAYSIPDVPYWQFMSELKGSRGRRWVEEQNMGRWVCIP